MINHDFENLQEKFCSQRGCECAITHGDEIIALASRTVGEMPINGLRHPPEEDNSGWYVWFGEVYSKDADFFVPLHAKHLVQQCPEIIELLGLPPGYRFLRAGEYLDIWFDPSLLEI